MIKPLLQGALLLIVGLLIGLKAAGDPPDPHPSNPGKPVHHHSGLSIEQIQGLAELVTTEVHVADVQQTRIDGYSGGIAAVLLVKGDYRLTVDLSSATFAAVDPVQRRATLILPPPQISSPRVDHAGTRLIAVTTSGLWHLVAGERAQVAVVNQAYLQAQQIIATAAAEPALQQRSREQAESVLGCFFDALDWSVTIRWHEPPP
jgi:hypothetical protein